MSYPDLIEQDGRYWITETQKTVARVHPIDTTLLEGLWNQGKVKTVAKKGLVLDLGPEEIGKGEAVMPTLPSLAQGGGFSVDFWIKLNELAADQIIADSRDASGQGFVVKTAEHGTIRIEMSDGRNVGFWACDRGVIKPGVWHHVAIIVDGAPDIISFVVDGILCDGGTDCIYGWGRFTPELNEVSGSERLRLAPSLEGQLKRLRVYGRYLRTSEAVANHRADERMYFALEETELLAMANPHKAPDLDPAVEIRRTEPDFVLYDPTGGKPPAWGDPDFFWLNEHLLVQPNGRDELLAMWTAERLKPWKWRIKYAHSKDGGASWTDAKVLDAMEVPETDEKSRPVEAETGVASSTRQPAS
jgi:hypothetical protein